MSATRALVTGAAGFLGSQLCERLLEAGAQVTGVDCFTPFYDPEIKRAHLERAVSHANFRLLEADLSRHDMEALPEVDEVYHLAAQAGVRSSWGRDFETYARHNVVATQRLLERYRDRPPRVFVYASSSSVYGDAERYPTVESDLPRPFSPYGVTKLAAEHLALLYHRNYGVPAVALRFFTVYGPRQRPDMGFHRFITALLEDRPIEIYGDGSQRRDFTFVEDCLDGVLAAGRQGKPGAVYNLGGGQARPLMEVLEVLAEVAGRRPRLEHVPPVPGDAPHTGADIARAREDLGYAPRRSLAEGLAAQFAWQRDRLATGRESA